MELVECRLAIDDLDAFVTDLNDIADRHGATVQAFDARYVADRRHIERAVELADRAIARGENVARNRAVEILLYAAGRRQIDRALEMGVGEGDNRAVVLVDRDTTAESEDVGVDSRAGAAPGADSDTTPDPPPNPTPGADPEAATVDAITALDAFVERETLLNEQDTTVDGPAGGDATDEETLCLFFEITDAERAATDASLGSLVRERVALLDVEK